MGVYNIIEQIKNTPGTNDKIAILEEHKNNDILKMVCLYAFNDTNFFIKKIPSYLINVPKISLQQGITDAIDELASRAFTGNAGIEMLAKILSALDVDDAKVLELIIKKDLDCGIAEKTINKVWKGLIKETPYKRCEKDFNKVQYPALAQTKADGMFVNILCGNVITVLSRNGKHADFRGIFEKNFNHLRGTNHVIHGELLISTPTGVMERKKGNGILSKAIKATITDVECELVVGKFWDVVPEHKWREGYDGCTEQDRYQNISDIVKDLDNPKIMLTTSVKVNTDEEAQAFYDAQIEAGEEGAVIKYAQAPWENKTSKYCIKMKSEKDCDLLCYATIPHKKNPDLIGAICCKDESGTLVVDVGSGLDDIDRALSPESFIGKIVTIKYNEMISSKLKTTKSLFLPRLIEMRLDKSTPDNFGV